MTFKVPDIGAALERLRSAGFHPVNVDLSDPGWKEAFLLPREAHGTVVQLAETNEAEVTRAQLLTHVAQHGPDAHPRWWRDPSPATGPRACLRRVVLRTPSLPVALGFFGGLLQGDVVADTGTAAELVWPRGSRLRIEEHPDAPPGIDRLEVEGLPEPVEVIGTRFVPAPA